jgi:sialate O-acetylesterase
MANVYGEKETVWSGPTFQSAAFSDGKATVSFDHAGGGLAAKEGAELKGFALAGMDHKWYWAEAKIIGKKIELKSKDVPHPVAVRYAWANHPTGNLINKEGLPAFPFRSDSWVLGKHGKPE